jgi:hypothetical protein
MNGISFWMLIVGVVLISPIISWFILYNFFIIINKIIYMTIY